jgi:hypothetical protein
LRESDEVSVYFFLSNVDEEFLELVGLEFEIGVPCGALFIDGILESEEIIFDKLDDFVQNVEEKIRVNNRDPHLGLLEAFFRCSS